MGVSEEVFAVRDVGGGKVYPLGEALRALGALRAEAGLPPEMFPVEAFVGMISDEVEVLRGQGRTDEEIAGVIGANSGIVITGAEIGEFYASPEARHGGGGGRPG